MLYVCTDRTMYTKCINITMDYTHVRRGTVGIMDTTTTMEQQYAQQLIGLCTPRV